MIVATLRTYWCLACTVDKFQMGVQKYRRRLQEFRRWSASMLMSDGGQISLVPCADVVAYTSTEKHSIGDCIAWVL